LLRRNPAPNTKSLGSPGAKFLRAAEKGTALSVSTLVRGNFTWGPLSLCAYRMELRESKFPVWNTACLDITMMPIIVSTMIFFEN